jgi:uncharacterized membrane protein
MDFGRLHVVVLHFPIALIVAMAVAGFLGLFGRRAFFQNASLYCLIGALLTAPAAVATGWDLLGDMRPSGEMPSVWNMLRDMSPTRDLATIAAWHRALAVAALVLVVAVAAVRLARAKSAAKWLAAAYVILVLATLAAVTATAHLGGMLAFGKDFLSGGP